VQAWMTGFMGPGARRFRARRRDSADAGV